MENRLSALGGVSKQIRSIQDQIDADYQQLNKLLDRRSDLIKRLEELRDNAAASKTARDEKNRIIAEKKAQRDQLHNERAALSEKIRELIDKKKALLANVDYVEGDLLSQLKEISWRYQTTTLSIQEDRKAVQRISDLEKRLVFFKKVKDLDQEIGRYKNQSGALKEQADAVHGDIVTLAEGSKNDHETVIKCYEERSVLAAELEDVKKAVTSLKATIGKSKDELFATGAQLRAMQNMERHHKADAMAEQAKMMINKRSELAERANEKVKNKERLTFEEFAAMVETKGVRT